MRLTSRLGWLALTAVLALALTGAADATVAGPQTPLAAATCDEATSDLNLLTPLSGDGVVWTGGTCSAQLTCESNCVKHCTGNTSCTVGSNYVECDGVRHYCPNCDVSEYPGRPPCTWGLCTWCVCRNQGGSINYCCYDFGT